MSATDGRGEDEQRDAAGLAGGDVPETDWGERVEESPEHPPKPGDVVASGDEELATSYGYRVGMVPEPVVGPDVDSPLAEDEPEGVVPANPLWAMKEHRHVAWHLLPAHERHQRLRARVADGDEAVYAIDDGRTHVTLGHRVGSGPDGAGYCLVGRVSREQFEDLRAGNTAPATAFDRASELTLCGVVAEDEVLAGSVFDVARYPDASAVPPEYLPGSPFIEFPEDLEITV